MQDFCQECNQENAAEITQSLLFPIFHSSLSYHSQCLTFPPGTQRPSSPPPASPASGPGSPGILQLLQSPPQPPLNLTLETSQTPLTPLHQPLSVSGSGEVSGRASTCLETKMLENCVTKAVGHRADCCHCSPLPLKISSASSYTSSCSLKPPRPTLNAHRL